MLSCYAYVLLMFSCVALLFDATLAAKQKIYYGEADLIHQLLNNTSEWTYVQENADGFYVGFGQLIINMSPDDLHGFFTLFKNKVIYYETDADPTHQALETDKAEIAIFHNGGWNITYTSQNFGWTQERDQILRYYNLTQDAPSPLDFVQIGPWTLSGNISNDLGSGPYSNAQFRAWINQSNGTSTDGPLGYWHYDYQQMRNGSYSVVQYAHSVGRLAAVMLCPYGAGIDTYNSTRDFVTAGISAIQGHEDNHADPDIWIIFEYSDDVIPAVPEQVNGYPANSTTGMAYYALKHRDGEIATLDLYINEGKIGQFTYLSSANLMLNSNVLVGTTMNYTLSVADYSAWLDYAACIRTFISAGQQDGWDIRYSIGEVDITEAITSAEGFIFIREHRLWSNSVQNISVFLTRTSTVNQSMILTIQLAPHRGSVIVDSLQIMTE